MKKQLKTIILSMSISVLGTNIQAQDIKNTNIQTPEYENIQEEIKNTLNKAFVLKSEEPLTNLENILTENQQQNSYWISYLNYHQTIFYLEQKNMEKANEYNLKSIDILKDKTPKTSEDYALLAYNQSLSFIFIKNQMQAMKIDAEIRENLQKGFKLDANNPRLFFVEGSYDSYTPKEYGGGKKVEKLLLKAISLFEHSQNFSLPTWGKEESYQLLIEWYLSENKIDKATKLFENFQREFPKNRKIKTFEQKLK